MEWTVVGLFIGAGIGMTMVLVRFAGRGNLEPTERQWAFIEALLVERDYDEADITTPRTRAEASELIDYLLSCRRIGRD